MIIKNIEIKGFRGFGESRIIELGLPNGEPGSGLTILVGPNNSGKSTIVESFDVLSRGHPTSFTEGKRNRMSNGVIFIQLINANGDARGIATIKGSGSETELINKEVKPSPENIFVLPSRRTLDPHFSKNKFDRASYFAHYEIPAIRGQASSNFYGRIFQIQEKRQEFDSVFRKVLDPLPQWQIDMSDAGRHYIKFDYGGLNHNSDGLGEGLLSLFFIIDALYDSEKDDVIVIDEPELSLHPLLQRKLSKLFAEYAADRQLVISTHSPYFIDWDSIERGGKIIRVVKEDNVVNTYQLSLKSIEKIRNLRKDINNPHVFGLNAREVFFLEDKVVLVEGQDDVIFYNKIINDLNIKFKGDFYGWGVGGSSKMNIIAGILQDLGFKKVVGILDKGKEADSVALVKEFPEYNFFSIPADDVRTKKARKESEKVVGLIDENGGIREEYKDQVIALFDKIDSKLSSCLE
jgi:predicted ATP-dependent endonuclease of OLD family